MLGCTSGVAYNVHDANAAYKNYVNSGVGTGFGYYFYMAGPGADPAYNGTIAEAKSWGRRQAQSVLGGINGAPNGAPTHRVVWMDIESGATNRYGTNGWNNVTYGCHAAPSPRVPVPYAVDRAVVDGFNSLISGAGYYGGVYSVGSFWNATFGPSGNIVGTWEWTYERRSRSITPGPIGWCQGSYCAQYFGGEATGDRTAIMWQWTIHGGDWDQAYAPYVPERY